ncbi:MAG: hypothetical protein I3J02_08550 [Prevotella sp.]|nr:hypothetical protein [Prevotella sp.]
MKKLLLLLFLVPTAMMGQQMKRHQFSVSVSSLGTPADKSFNDFTKDVCRRAGYDYDSTTTFPLLMGTHAMVTLRYEYRVDKHLLVGLTAGWGTTWRNYHHYEVDEAILWVIPTKTHTTDDLRMKSHTFYLAPTVRYEWYHSTRNMLRAYSGASVGITRQTLKAGWRVPDAHPDEKHTRWKLGYHLSALGLEVGPESFMMFGELGYGHQCVFNMGFRVGL